LSFSVIYNPSVDDHLEGTLTRSLAILPLAFYLLYLYIQYHEVRDYQPEAAVPRLPALPEWLRLIISMVVVTIGVELLLRSAIDLGHVLETPSYFWGITIIAAATSVPDLFMSIKAARREVSVSSLSNALGSNIFDLLAVLPIGVIAAGTVSISFSRVMPMLAFLILATVVVLVLMRRDFELTNRDGILLLAFYAGFILWMALQAFGVIAVMGGKEAA
jgi:cation:H+ antiporter